MTEPGTAASLLLSLASCPDADLEARLAGLNQDRLLDEVLTETGRRLDAELLGQAGVTLEVICHTADRRMVRYLRYDGFDPQVTHQASNSTRLVRFEWQRLGDAVRYELGRLMLESIGLIGRFDMAGSRADLALLLRAERVPHDVGLAIRSVLHHRDLSGRALDKALRDIEPGPVLLDQQRATNEAATLFGLLPELANQVVEWQVGRGSGSVTARTEYRPDGFSTELTPSAEAAARFQFATSIDFYKWIMGRTNVATLAIQGDLRFEGDFGVIQTLARLPEPFDPVERWGSE